MRIEEKDLTGKSFVLNDNVSWNSAWGDMITLPIGKYRVYSLSKDTYTVQNTKTGQQFALSDRDIYTIVQTRGSFVESSMKKVQEAHFNFKTLVVAQPAWLMTVDGKSRKLTPDVYDIRTYKATDDSYIVSGEYVKVITYGEYIEDLIMDGDAYLEESMRIDGKRSMREANKMESKRRRQEVGPMKGELSMPVDVEEFTGVDVYPLEDESYMAVMDDEMYMMEPDMEPEYIGPAVGTDMSMYEPMEDVPMEVYEALNKIRRKKMEKKVRRTEATILDTDMRKMVLMDYFKGEHGEDEVAEMDPEYDIEEVGRGRDVKEFSTPYGDYLVLTDEEADEMVEDQFEMYEDIGMFTPSFQEWIMDNAVDIRGWFEDAMQESYEMYVQDMKDEPGYGTNDDGEDYENRLEQEMDEAGVEDEEEYVEYLMKQYDDAKDWYKENFGEEEFYKAVTKYGRVDWSKVAEEAISQDGRGAFLATYDFEEIEHRYERDTFYIYRTN